MTNDTLYWILSTLPQVIGAMTGLLIAGITFFFQSLDKEVEKDESRSTAAHEVKRRIYRETVILLVVSILTIFWDVILIRFVPELTEIINSTDSRSYGECLALTMSRLITIGTNIFSFVLLFMILHKILDPDYIREVNDSLANKQKEDIPENDSVDPQVFIEYFRKFEKVVRSFYSDIYPLRKAPLRTLIRQLENDRIITPHDVEEIQGIINKRNIYIHGGDIGRVSKKIIDVLSRYIADLEVSRKKYMARRGISRMEESFRIWIDKYVDEFSDAVELDQAVRYEMDYGMFKVSRDGDLLFIYVDDGRSLYLRGEKAKKTFLDILEEKYSLGDGLSLEDSDSFQRAIDDDR